MVDVKESRVFCFPIQIILAAQKEGIDIHTLHNMLKHSTRITHQKGNRRYEGWLFLVEGNDVLGFGKMEENFQDERTKLLNKKPGYSLNVNVIDAAAKEGISESTLRQMLKESKRISHPHGNRRYNGWLFQVNDGNVVTFGRIQDTGDSEEVFEPKKVPDALSSVDAELNTCETCFGLKKISAFNECERCGGSGCKYCDRGLVPGQIPCPACA